MMEPDTHEPEEVTTPGPRPGQDQVLESRSEAKGRKEVQGKKDKRKRS